MSQRKYLTLSLLCLLAIIGLLFVIGGFLNSEFQDIKSDPNLDNSGVGAAASAIAVAFLLVIIYGIAFALCAVALLKLLGIMIARNWFTAIMIILDVAILAIAIYAVFSTAIPPLVLGPQLFLSIGVAACVILNLVFDIASLRDY